MSAIFATLGLLTSAPAAKVGTIELGELVRFSDLICVATVSDVVKRDGMRFGFARVEQVVKGRRVATIEYLAQPTWVCDVSDAKVGERVVLFLTTIPAGTPLTGQLFAAFLPEELRDQRALQYPVQVINHSGRGRIPLRHGDLIDVQHEPGSKGRRATYSLHQVLLPSNLAYTRKGKETTLALDAFLNRVRTLEASKPPGR